MTRITHVVPALFDPADGVVGGAERYALELARHMAEVVPTRLVTFGQRPREETTGRLTIRVLGPPHLVRNQPANPVTWSLLGEALRADIVHCHQQHIVASSLMAAACRLTGRRVYVSDLGGGGWDISGYVSTDRWYHGHLHLSQFSRRVFGHDGQPRAHVIYGGVDTKRFAPDPAVQRGSTVLFVGRILPHKGVDTLVRAARPGMPVEIIGHPYDLRYLEDVRRLAAGKAVRFRHDCGEPELVRAYREARCLVLPSVYRDMYGSETIVPELLGQTLLEAMACGTPVICTNVGSLLEIVEHEVTGLVVPPNDPDALASKLQWIAEHPDAARAMGEAGRRRVLERFTWPAVAQRCLAIYGVAAG
jgi:glycosyltransferase involved in cell wall biosynthesis